MALQLLVHRVDEELLDSVDDEALEAEQVEDAYAELVAAVIKNISK